MVACGRLPDLDLEVGHLLEGGHQPVFLLIGPPVRGVSRGAADGKRGQIEEVQSGSHGRQHAFLWSPAQGRRRAQPMVFMFNPGGAAFLERCSPLVLRWPSFPQASSA